MDTTTITTMLESGHATVADLAKHFGKPQHEIREFLREHQIPTPTVQHPSYQHIRKLMAMERFDPAPLDGLLYDDPQHNVINGINCATSTPNLKADDILRWYHGELHCMFTGDPTATVAAVDGNAQNFLVTNLIPVTNELFTQRFQHSPPLYTSYRFTSHGVELELHFLHRYDKLFGGSIKPMFIEAVVDQWVRPYCENVTDTLAPYAATAEHFALWVWRHLSTQLVKGLARIDCHIGAVGSSLTAQQYQAIVFSYLRQRVGDRLIATPNSAPVSPLIKP